MESTVAGNSTFNNWLHPAKAANPTVRNCCGRTTLVRFMPKKAVLGMVCAG